MVLSVRAARLTATIGTMGLLAGCAGAPAPPSPSASASDGQPTTEASAMAAPTSPTTGGSPRATDGPAPEGALVIVVADELRIRAEPGIDGAVVGSIGRGAVVRTNDGPIEADGFRWYEVVDSIGREGWAADGDGSDPWLSAIESTEDVTPLLTFGYGCDVVGPFNAPSTVVFDDGRVVMRDSDSPGYIVRRLSPAGVAHLEDNVVSSPYLQRSAEYMPVQRADAGEPPGHGLCNFSFTVGTDAEPIVVRSVSWFGEEEETMFYEPAPERKALDEIAHNLMVIDSVLDESSWETSGWLPFIAEEYVLWVGPGVGPAPGGLVAIDPDALPIEVDGFGEPAASGRCATISREQTFELARALNQEVGAAAVRLDAVTFHEFEANDTWMSLTLVPRTPRYELSCDDFSF
ncbi:MAG TPA: SH3 domain-containing protein [Candidatus Limnocylindria bacterium]